MSHRSLFFSLSFFLFLIKKNGEELRGKRALDLRRLVRAISVRTLVRSKLLPFVTAAAGEEEFEKKRNDTKFLCTIDAHSQSIKSIAAAGPFFCSGGHDDRIRAFHVNTRGEISDVGSLTGHSGTVTCIAFAKPSIYGKREDDDDDGKKCTTKNNKTTTTTTTRRKKCRRRLECFPGATMGRF